MSACIFSIYWHNRDALLNPFESLCSDMACVLTSVGNQIATSIYIGYIYCMYIPYQTSYLCHTSATDQQYRILERVNETFLL